MSHSDEDHSPRNLDKSEQENASLIIGSLLLEHHDNKLTSSEIFH